MEAPPLETRTTFASKPKMFAKWREESWKKEDKAFWLRLAEDWAKLSHAADVKPKRR